MQRHEAFLHVGAGAHFLRAADQHAHRAIPDPFEERLLLRVGFGITHRGDLLAGDAVGDELPDDLLIGRITLGITFSQGRGPSPAWRSAFGMVDPTDSKRSTTTCLPKSRRRG
jgi:hypothetical protein